MKRKDQEEKEKVKHFHRIRNFVSGWEATNSYCE